MFNLFNRIPVINKHTVEKNGLVYYKNELFDGEAKAIDSHNRKTLIVECLKGKKIGPWLEDMHKYGGEWFMRIHHLFLAPNSKILKYWNSHFAIRKASGSGIKWSTEPSDLDRSFALDFNIFDQQAMDLSFYGNYHDGLKEGIWRSKSNRGDVFCEFTFSNNEKHGKATWYFVNGKIRCLGSYKNGKMNGEWTWYYDNGQIEKIIKFRDNLPYGQKKFFESDGVAQGKQAVKKDRTFKIDNTNVI